MFLYNVRGTSKVTPYRKPRHPGQKAHKNRRRIASGTRGSWRNKPVTSKRKFANRATRRQDERQ